MQLGGDDHGPGVDTHNLCGKWKKMAWRCAAWAIMIDGLCARTTGPRSHEGTSGSHTPHEADPEISDESHISICIGDTHRWCPDVQIWMQVAEGTVP